MFSDAQRLDEALTVVRCSLGLNSLDLKAIKALIRAHMLVIENQRHALPVRVESPVIREERFH